MTIPTPTVTIAIPTFNRRDLVLQAIDSSLKQSYPAIEVIVADNASEDGTKDAIEKINDPKLRYYRHDNNIGFSANWNFCLSQASGEYFLLLSDDDLLKPTAIDQMVAPFLGSDADKVAFVYGRVLIEDNVATPSVEGPDVESVTSFTKEFFSCRRSIYPCSTLLRTDDIRELGGYDEAKFYYALDAAIWVGTGFKRRDVIFVRDIVGTYRMHSSNLTSTATCNIWIDGLSSLFALAAKMASKAGNHPDVILRLKKKYIGRFLLQLLKNKNDSLNIPTIRAVFPYISIRKALSLASTAARNTLKRKKSGSA